MPPVVSFVRRAVFVESSHPVNHASKGRPKFNQSIKHLFQEINSESENLMDDAENKLNMWWYFPLHRFFYGFVNWTGELQLSVK